MVCSMQDLLALGSLNQLNQAAVHVTCCALQALAELQDRSEAAEAARGAGVGGQELEELRGEYEQRISAAERKVSNCSPHDDLQPHSHYYSCQLQCVQEEAHSSSHDLKSGDDGATAPSHCTPSGVRLDQGA
jgi:hypothetical protein